MFTPQSRIEKGDSNNSNSVSEIRPAVSAPEKQLTIFALRLAVLEKVATSLGTLGFIWATVVLLGGFAITLAKTDFWFITIILLIEGTRIFSRSHELEWQHQATWSVTDAGINSFRALSKLLYWLQLLSATACVVLSLLKLIKHDYGEVAKGDSDKRNRKSALTIFYALALAEALMFLVEKAYWEWKLSFCRLLEKVNKECDLGDTGMVSIRRFFYDAYSKCVNGSIFDGLKMDMVSFAMDLLASNSPDEQLIGARILRQFAMSERYSDDTLQKIGINLPVIERLVEMLNWKDPQEEEIRQSAAEILSKLAGKKQNSLRVAGIPGAMESISSLLQTHRNPSRNYGYWTFNHLGLLILKKLARDHDNCGKIGNTRGLLPKIVDFTHAEDRLLKDENVTQSQILTVKRSLQLVKMLASTTGSTGKLLRSEISEVVFTISNIREILRNGEKHPKLQKLGIEILTSLALEENATERIGGTGGVLKGLFNIFFKQGMAGDQNHVKIAAGQALAMLTMDSKSNCHRILKLKVLEKLVGALEVPLLSVNAARILRNLCAFSGSECFNQLTGVRAAAPTVLKAIMSEENKLQEVMLGLAAHGFKFMTSEESSVFFEKTGIKEVHLAHELVEILRKYKYPPIKVPRIRRFTIELAIWMMRDKETNVHIFKDLGMEKELEGVLETTSEIESFNIFSGTVGLNRHGTSMHSLVETALKLLEEQ
ncbi:unnamed protein product, partial [Vitis vinifera]